MSIPSSFVRKRVVNINKIKDPNFDVAIIAMININLDICNQLFSSVNGKCYGALKYS